MDIDPEHLAALTSKITPIGIEDLSCIESYDLSTSGENVVHTVRFHDGGWVILTFRPNGTVFMRTDGMLEKRFQHGGTVLCALSDADIDGMKGHTM